MVSLQLHTALLLVVGVDPSLFGVLGVPALKSGCDMRTLVSVCLDGNCLRFYLVSSRLKGGLDCKINPDFFFVS